VFNIPIDNNCTDDELHIRMPGSRRDYEAEGDEINTRKAIPTPTWRQRRVTDLERFDMGTSDGDGYSGENGNHVDADANEVEEASQTDDGSTQNVVE
jgi:hypothetical protein